MDITINQAKEHIIDVLRAGLVPNLLGSPGLGKSDLVRQIAKELSLKVIDLRLAQMDPTDLVGLPSLDGDRSNYAPPANFPLEEDKVPEGYNGWLMFFDEANSAPQGVQSAAYKVILDKMVGQHNIHKNVAMVCAGNLTTDKAVVNRMSTALQSRLIHFNLMVDSKAWQNWAVDNDVDFRVRSFIDFRPELLHKFDPKHSDNTFPCPRTWEFLSKLIKGKKELTTNHIPLLAGAVGEGTAYEFREYTEIYKKIPTLTQIMANPTGIKMPEEPSHKYAVTSLIGEVADKENIDNLMAFVERMDLEFQVITLQKVIRAKKDLMSNSAINDWIKKYSKELYF